MTSPKKKRKPTLVKEMVWLKPKQNRVVVRRNKETRAKPGRILVEVKRQKPQEGVVLSIGPLVKDRKLVGQHVLFLEWSGQDAPGPSGEEYITLSEDEIICEVDVATLTRLEEQQAADQARREAQDADDREKIRQETLSRSSAVLVSVVALEPVPQEDPPASTAQDPAVSVGG